MRRLVTALRKPNWGKTAYVVVALCATTANALLGQTLTTLRSFDVTDGLYPQAGLVQATNGDLYGTTELGGAYTFGTVFKITPHGTLTTLYSFGGDGKQPLTGLVQGTHKDLYGTTVNGAYGEGTVFKITPSGTLTTLYNFCAQLGCPDGAYPQAGLVQAINGDFYGTTEYGGAHCSYLCGGTVFKITASGTLTTLYSFCSQSGCTDGQNPTAKLIQATDGSFYGTTYSGGANYCFPYGCGTIFKITASGTLTTLYSFCSQSGCMDGQNPQAGLVQATNGDFYGTTYYGGANNGGTVFKITPSGTLTTLYSFCCTDGADPAGLVQATNGDFYGITLYGGAVGDGTIFKITPSGTLTTLYSFCSQSGCTDGQTPQAKLVQATNGEFYGTTYGGGTAGAGTVFSLSVGLGPFVKTLPHAGRVGEVIRILGTDLTDATNVSFKGTPATFNIVGATENHGHCSHRRYNRKDPSDDPRRHATKRGLLYGAAIEPVPLAGRRRPAGQAFCGSD